MYQTINSFSLGSGTIDDFYSLPFANLYVPRIYLCILYSFHNGKFNFLFNKLNKILPGCPRYGVPFSLMFPVI